MPKALPPSNAIFNEPRVALSEMRSDGHTVPHFNSSATLTISNGEPIPKTAGGSALVYLAQSFIPPGEWRSLVRHWDAEFPCDVSADVFDGDSVYWDVDTEKVSLVADVTNGFLLGWATYAVLPGQTPQAAEDGRVVVATATSTLIRVVATDVATTIKGIVVVAL